MDILEHFIDIPDDEGDIPEAWPAENLTATMDDVEHIHEAWLEETFMDNTDDGDIDGANRDISILDASFLD
ncbi:Uncharacterized protein TCM_022659 [Theobroma cacao]|uniref:Uncharacterized protein n=1 Tax=Theobroma cacao TaxID=3641 RepID=A0A061EV77_THECC|nr:Uncharacterized protein TCM_022659 [Theobroma cacao]